MKTMTIDDALNLHNFIVEKSARVASLEKIVAEIRSDYKNMADSQLNEAVRDVAGMLKEIEEHKAWMAKAREMLNKFFAPAAA